jgi:hypothetical protein
MTKIGNFLNEAHFDYDDNELLKSLNPDIKPKGERPEYIVTHGEEQPWSDDYFWSVEDAMNFVDKLDLVENPQVTIWHGVEPIHTWLNGKRLR